VPVEIRATGDATLQDVLRVVLAGVRAGAGFVLSTPSGLPAAVRHALSDLDATVFLESEGEWMQRMLGTAGADGDLPSAVASAVVRQGRVRLVGGRSSVAALHAALTTASGGDPDLAVYDGEVTSAGRIELLPFVREQSISITTHRDGTPDPWSAPVI
jgi:RHH-type proline utilization regulon transcriptional repressor/proline dehydrogenase/delta 1-pyrroline-5-carboxylate dehydrogenase